ncbi:hypothetical protein [Curtobacterium poinsettiae]|uniref:hypothetical protein n=1 Tax=Curtobacterium TaxID=2034 RepID=UPI00217DE2C9|nr:hypothetical protein [Curtobacterium flaccumfaciens]MCS6562451.1 hypothetical protein [Curtobacterium flaccumfaciens pv. poinsettiae]UXN28507.1 hypothetical protein N8D75_16185 [Curtobacterium flaccumfaciens]
MLLDPGSIAEVAESAVDAMLAISPDDAMFVRSWWPHSACDVSAIVISQLLLDRGDDSWRVVTAESETRRAAHTWLERRNDSGEVEFSIDVTLHQFAWITDKPFYGAGESPARQHFTRITYDYPAPSVPWIGTEDQVHLTTLRQVRALMT